MNAGKQTFEYRFGSIQNSLSGQNIVHLPKEKQTIQIHASMKDKILHSICTFWVICVLQGPSFAQQIKFDPNDCYQIVSNHGLVLSNQNSREDGTNIFLADPASNETSQAWSFIQVDEEYFQIGRAHV